MNQKIPDLPAAALPVLRFRQQLSSSARGARLARRLTVQQLAMWGRGHQEEPVERAALVVAELAANAVTHGRVAGRDFLLTLTLDLTPTPDERDGAGPSLRVEVSDSRGELLPVVRSAPDGPSAEGGRGLLIVEALASAWGSAQRLPYGKTVWAEVSW